MPRRESGGIELDCVGAGTSSAVRWPWVRARLLLWVLLGACGSDGTAPAPGTITGREPGPGEIGVSVASPVRITLSSTVELSPDVASVAWLEEGGIRVPVTVTSRDRRTVLITPEDVLEPGTAYTVQTGTGLGGAAPSSWTFTTAGEPVPALEGARLLAHVQALAHDSMAGRGSGTADELRAANYIRSRFSQYGLTPFTGTLWYQPFSYQNLGSQNVVGVIRGEGKLRDDWIMVGAHYDHVGIRNGQIYNGADDNASGTAGLLEVARVLALHAAGDRFGSPDRRSIMFIGFGMEELGLIGSFFYCESPLAPLSRLTAMLNLDMIGRLRDDTVYMIGQNTAQEWPALLRRYDSGLGYQPLDDGGSDHRCFRQRGRPVLTFFTGLHAEYHQPADDPATLNVTGLTRVADLALELVVNLAVRPRPLTP